MKITNFIITYIDNRLFLISLFLLFSMFMLLIAYERLNKLIFFILFGLISVFLCNTKNIASKISQKQLTIFYTNEDDKTIKINKTQIIKEILNGNIKEGNKCLEEYIDFIYNYMKIKNSIILRILLFMNEIDLTLYLTDQHFKYMESLIKKEYGENVTVKFSNHNEYCFCEFYDTLSIAKVFVLCFNDKQVKNIGNIKFCDYSICDLPFWKI